MITIPEKTFARVAPLCILATYFPTLKAAPDLLLLEEVAELLDMSADAVRAALHGPYKALRVKECGVWHYYYTRDQIYNYVKAADELQRFSADNLTPDERREYEHNMKFIEEQSLAFTLTPEKLREKGYDYLVAQPLSLTRGQAADFLGVSTSTLAQWQRSGTLVGVRSGHHVYYAAHDLALLATQRRRKRSARQSDGARPAYLALLKRLEYVPLLNQLPDEELKAKDGFIYLNRDSVTRSEAAQLLGISAQRLADLAATAKKGKQGARLLGYRAGNGRVYYTIDQLKDYAATHGRVS